MSGGRPSRRSGPCPGSDPRFDDLGAGDPVVEHRHAAGDMGLLLLGGVVFGVLGEVAVGDGLLDVLDVGGSLDRLQSLQLGFQGCVATRSHRDSLVHSILVARVSWALTAFLVVVRGLCSRRATSPNS